MAELHALDSSTCFTKENLLSRWKKSKKALEGWIFRSCKNGKLLQLKNGLYIDTDTYIHEPDKEKFHEYIASRLIPGSYISQEYILEKHSVLPRRPERSITSITTKTNRSFKNFAGKYMYANLKPSLHVGCIEVNFHGNTYRIATKAKALFDYFYLNSNLDYRNHKHLKHQIFKELDIQWAYISEEDFKEFDAHVWKSNSAKMMRVLRHVTDYFEAKNFDVWAKELLL